MRHTQRENNELKLSLQQTKLEVQNQKKILQAELGCEFVNSSQLLGNGFKAVVFVRAYWFKEKIKKSFSTFGKIEIN